MEQSFVAWAKVRASRLPKVKLGIGDDAAVIESNTNDLVVTTDTLLDGVHFRLEEVGPERVGKKAVNVNLSDLAAMGAQPEAILLSLCLPPKGPDGMLRDALAAELFESICRVCESNSIALAGGDTNCWNGPLVLHVTALGRVADECLWTRAGAQPNDLVVVTGPLGGSILGKHLDFSPRLDVARAVRGLPGINAAMDISDGLSVDLLRICDSSRCGAILEFDKIPISQAAHQLSSTSGKSPLEHALGDGEDFELLFAVNPAMANQVLERLSSVSEPTVCGQFTSRTGLWSRQGAKLRQLPATGYVHGEVDPSAALPPSVR